MTLVSMRTAIRPIGRAPDNELYNRGCDLVEAAASISRAAVAPEAVRATPAVLGCIEAALRELTTAAAALEQTADRSATSEARSGRMHRGYANLREALQDAEGAAAAARPLAGRALSAGEGDR